MFDEAAINRISVDDDNELDGDCDKRRGVITIRPGLSHDAEAEVLLHEVLHAVTGSVGLDETLGADTDEKVVRAITPTLLDTLRRNPALRAYLFGETSG